MTTIGQSGGSDSIAGERLGPFLGPNERLILVGRPQQGVVLRGTDLRQVPLGLFFVAFALYSVNSVASIQRGPLTFLVIYSLIFVVIGLYFAVGRFFHDAMRRSRTFYGLTNQRVLILSALGPARLVSRDLENPGPVTVVEQPNRRGTIAFGTPISTSWWAWNRN